MKNLTKTILGITIALTYGVVMLPIFMLIFYNRIDTKEKKIDG